MSGPRLRTNLSPFWGASKRNMVVDLVFLWALGSQRMFFCSQVVSGFNVGASLETSHEETLVFVDRIWSAFKRYFLRLQYTYFVIVLEFSCWHVNMLTWMFVASARALHPGWEIGFCSWLIGESSARVARAKILLTQLPGSLPKHGMTLANTALTMKTSCV